MTTLSQLGDWQTALNKAQANGPSLTDNQVQAIRAAYNRKARKHQMTTNWYTNAQQGTGSTFSNKITIKGSSTASTEKIVWGHQSSRNKLIRDAEVVDGHAVEIELPNGEVLDVDEHGNFEVRDEDAEIVYRASRSRAFNPFVNASNVIGAFLEYCLSVPGVTREDLSDLPLQLFVQWLIIEAAERDGDPVPEDVDDPQQSEVLQWRARPQCELPTCRRFIPKSKARAGLRHCGPQCSERHHRMLKAA